MLRGRLGLDSAKVPYKDRAGLLHLARSALTARDGTLAFLQDVDGHLDPGDYAIPLQGVSMILLGPGSTVSHDALRLLAHARTALAAVGENGVRLYTAPRSFPIDRASRGGRRCNGRTRTPDWRPPDACTRGASAKSYRIARSTSCAESKARA